MARVQTIPGIQPGAVHTPGFLQGQNEFQSAWVRVATWCQARRQVQFPTAMALGLTGPREIEMFVLFPDVKQNP